MASDRLMKLIDEVQNLSSSYAQVTSELSDQIIAFEKRLNALGGKVEAAVQSTDRSRLSFERKSGDWKIVVYMPDSHGILLSSAPVKLKLLGVKLLEPLLLEMLRIQAELHTEALEAQAIIGPLLGSLAPKNKQEGK